MSLINFKIHKNYTVLFNKVLVNKQKSSVFIILSAFLCVNSRRELTFADINILFQAQCYGFGICLINLPKIHEENSYLCISKETKELPAWATELVMEAKIQPYSSEPSRSMSKDLLSPILFSKAFLTQWLVQNKPNVLLNPVFLSPKLQLQNSYIFPCFFSPWIVRATRNKILSSTIIHQICFM